MLKTILSEMKRRSETIPADRRDASARYSGAMADFFLAAFEGARPVVYTSFYSFPMEILAACGVAPFDFEMGSSILGFLDSSGDLPAEAEARGFSTDLCSVHRASLGAYLRGHFPKPDLLVTTSFYCGGKAKTNEILSGMSGVPAYLLAVPQEVSRESVNYVQKQLREVADRVADLTGTPFDEDRLKEVVGHSNRAREAQLDLLSLLANRPAPWGGDQLFNYSFFSHMYDGLPVLADIHNGYAAKLRERIGSGKLRAERHRVFWYAWAPVYRNTIFDTLKKHEVSVPVCETFLVHWDEIDEQHPFEGLALKCLTNPFIGRVQRRIDLLNGAVERFGIDGAILLATPACRHSKGNGAIMKEALGARGLPLLVLDVDMADPRVYAEEQTRTRIEGFIEMLDSRK
jgi:benzoyl-CoA reductase/2-hydroxyglutaryl-CoA dehydratase subunit BcrC/BadD/HgdB